jgi:hypothetical protein
MVSVAFFVLYIIGLLSFKFNFDIPNPDFVYGLYILSVYILYEFIYKVYTESNFKCKRDCR